MNHGIETIRQTVTRHLDEPRFVPIRRPHGPVTGEAGMRLADRQRTRELREARTARQALAEVAL